MATRLKQISLIILAAYASVFFSLTPLASTTVSAANEYPGDVLDRWFYYRGMWACLEGGMSTAGHTFSRSDVNSGDFALSNEKEGFGYIAFDLDGGNDKDGTVECNDNTIWTEGPKMFGFKDTIDFLCEMNRTGVGGKIDPNGDDCEKSTEFTITSGGGGWQGALTDALDKYGKRPRFHLPDNPDWQAMAYLMGKRSLEQFCGSGVSLEDGIEDLTNDDNRVSVDVVTVTDGKATIKKSQIYLLKGDRDQDSKVDDSLYLTDSHRSMYLDGEGGGNANEGDDARCKHMANFTRAYSTDYAKWLTAHPNYLEKEEKEQNENPEATGDTVTCNIEGIGWVVCPLTQFIGDLNDQAYGFLANSFLSVDPALFKSSTTQTAWASFRDIANVLFVIAFMAIIYSQITGGGGRN